MKLVYETPEDQKSLYDIFWAACMQTEKFLLEEPYCFDPTFPEYRLITLNLRRKIYEFLEEEDPNEPHWQAMEKRDKNIIELRKELQNEQN